MMKKIYLFILTLLCIVLNIDAQNIVRSEVSYPNVLRSSDVCDKLIKEGYVSPRNNVKRRALPTIPDKTAYAFLLDNNDPIEHMGVISFQIPKPDVYNIIRACDMNSAVYTGFCIEDIYYAFMVKFSATGFAFPIELATIDLKTGEKKHICSLEHLDELVFSDMTYDYSTGTVYGTANTEGMFKSALYKFSIVDGTATKVCVMDGTYILSIACTYDGQMYGLGTGGGLYKINKETGALTLIGNTGYMPWFIQSMDFDHTDNKLYWAGADAEHTFLAQVDTDNASVMEIGTFESNSNVTGLYIPFTRVSKGAPDKVTDLSVTAGQKGELYADLKWTNPVVDPFGNKLSGTMGIKLYRDNELIANITGKQPGESCSYTDNDFTVRGLYNYRVVAYNDLGDGERSTYSLWIGEDYPSQPEDISLEAMNGTVNITWSIPTVGQHGGWVNHARISSEVYRVEDNTLVAQVNGYSCSDKNLTTLGNWSYKVVVSDEEGNNAEAISDTIVAGPAKSLPFFEDFQLDGCMDLWTIVNMNNDTMFWKQTNYVYDNGARYLEYNRDYYMPAQEIAFAPPVQMYVGHDYKISFDSKIKRLGLLTQEKLALIASHTPSPDFESDTIAKFTLQDYDTEWSNRDFVYSPDEDGAYYIGLYLYSDAYQNDVCVDNWRMEEYYFYDLEAVSVSGGTSAMTGIGANYDVTIYNKGAKDVPSYTVCLVDENGTALTEELNVNETIKSGETRKLTFLWVPKEEKLQSVYCKVTLQGDGDESNNLSPALKVNVQSSSEYEVTIGESWGQTNLPFAQDYEGGCYTQSIYLQSEINSLNGLVRELTWYTSGIEVMPVEMKVKIYMANTDRSDLTGGTISVDDMTLVYDGNIAIQNSAQREINIELENPFLYEGKNIALHIYKESQGRSTYGWRGGFDYFKADGQSNVTVFNNKFYDTYQDYKPVLTMRLNSSGNAVSGDVSDENGQALEGVEVSIPNLGLKTLTDENGHYVFDLVNQGEYDMHFVLRNYYDVVEHIVVSGEQDNSVEKDVTMKKMETCDLQIAISDVAGSAVNGANIKLEGYDSRDVMTDQSGEYVFENLVRDDYLVTVTADDYQSYSDTLRLKDNKTVEASYVLNPQAYPVNGFSVDDEEYKMSWGEPVRLLKKVYDDGVLLQRAGYAKGSASEYGIFGIAVNDPGIVKSVQWYLVGDPGQTEREVILYIFYMGDDGYPLRTPVYTKRGIVSDLNTWFEYKLDDEFKAEKPFYVALSCPDDYLGLGIDSGTFEDDRSKSQFFTSDYVNSEYYYGEIRYFGNFMIRLDMTELNPGKLQTSSLIECYNLYRFLAADKNDSTKWNKIYSGLNTSFDDKEMESMPQGYYMYSVSVQWNGAGSSEVKYSDVLAKDMLTNVKIQITSNVEEKGALDGTEITLKSKDGAYSYSGVIKDDVTEYTFPEVSKGEYSMVIVNPRFDRISTDIAPVTDDEYVFGPYKLIETLNAPVNLQAESADNGEYNVSWNYTSSIFEDFESHDDFALNSKGNIGWSYLDNDDNASTYGLSLDGQRVEYDNWGARTAYIVFNPSMTDPRTDTSSDLSPWSGNKFLGSFSSSTGANDDFIISPELFFNEDFTLSFYARSYTDIYGADRMMVGYSVTDIEPESFTWIQGGDFQTVPAYWQQYSYTIPSSAKYIAIRCVSDNSFLFMVDDIQIGPDTPLLYDTYAKSYEVYLDGNKIGNTTSNSYVVKAGDGSHTIGVKAVYDTGVSDMSTIVVNNDGSSIDAVENNIVKYQNKELVFDGVAERVIVYSVSGCVIAEYTDVLDVVNLEHLSQGIYIAVVLIDGEEHVVKFVI